MSLTASIGRGKEPGQESKGHIKDGLHLAVLVVEADRQEEDDVIPRMR